MCMRKIVIAVRLGSCSRSPDCTNKATWFVCFSVTGIFAVSFRPLHNGLAIVAGGLFDYLSINASPHWTIFATFSSSQQKCSVCYNGYQAFPDKCVEEE